MQIYAIDSSFIVGQSFTIGVQPDSRFSCVIYQQADSLELRYFSGIDVQATSGATSTETGGKRVIQSGGSSASMRFDQDWNWPTVTLPPDPSVIPQTGAYIVVAYDVDDGGGPAADLGVVAGRPIFGSPPDSDDIALVIGRPGTPSAAIAYVIPIATRIRHRRHGDLRHDQAHIQLRHHRLGPRTGRQQRGRQCNRLPHHA